MSQTSASRQDEAAAVIQKHVRRYQAQKRYKQQQSAASTIQQHTTRFLARRKVGYSDVWTSTTGVTSCCTQATNVCSHELIPCCTPNLCIHTSKAVLARVRMLLLQLHATCSPQSVSCRQQGTMSRSSEQSGSTLSCQGTMSASRCEVKQVTMHHSCGSSGFRDPTVLSVHQ
jgi:hypothetical protein